MDSSDRNIIIKAYKAHRKAAREKGISSRLKLRLRCHDEPWPPGFKHLKLTLAPGALHIVVGGEGPPLMLVHGLGGSGGDFSCLAPELADRFTLIIPDLFGFGRSSKPDAPYTSAWFCQILADLNRELGLSQAAWLGHSMGGLLVLRLAANHPELASKVVAVCPAGGHNRIEPKKHLLLRLLASPSDRLRLWHPVMLNLAIHYIFEDPYLPSARQLQERLLRQWSGQERPLLERSLIRAARDILQNPVWPLLKGMTTPVLLVGGAQDRVIPREEIDRLLSRLNRGRACLLGGDHMLPFSRPSELARAILNFFDQLA